MNRLNWVHTAFLAGTIILGTCGADGQNPPLQGPSAPQKPEVPLRAADAIVHKGLFTIDVVVTNETGSPVSDLAPWDFTLLDNGQPAKIRTFSNSLAPSEPAPELIFVVDTVNLSPQQLRQTESAIAGFFLRNNGHLEYPCLLYRLTREGLFSSLRPSKDGFLLLSELEGTRSLWTVWRAVLGSRESDLTSNRFSLRALGAIAIDRRDVPGHKVVLWIGAGWSVNGGEIGFDEATEFSTRLREARITLDNLDAWLNPVSLFNYRDYLKAPPVTKGHAGGPNGSAGDCDAHRRPGAGLVERPQSRHRALRGRGEELLHPHLQSPAHPHDGRIPQPSCPGRPPWPDGRAIA